MLSIITEVLTENDSVIMGAASFLAIFTTGEVTKLSPRVTKGTKEFLKVGLVDLPVLGKILFIIGQSDKGIFELRS